MKRAVLSYGIGYGLLGGVLIAALRWTEYRFLVVEHSIEIYGGLTAATFAGLGIWLGVRLTRRPEIAAAPLPPVSHDVFVADERRQAELGLTRREFEILELMAEGLSNREMAERLFVSENTVKTHSSRVLGKLGAKRRTQAVQLGKEFGLLP